jgi:regulator of sigma E protease
MSIVIAIIIFGVIILVHEIGHFAAARIFNMRVISFNLGMGPVLLKKRGKETAYQIKAIPFGGSVQLGEDDEEAVINGDTRDFRNKPVWQRMIVILAGAFMNVVLGFVLCAVIVSTGRLVGTTVIHSFDSGEGVEPLSSRTLMSGDKVVAVNGMRVFTRGDINYQLANTESKLTDDNDRVAFEFTVTRNGQRLVIENVEFHAQANDKGGMQIVDELIWVGVPKNVFSVLSGAMMETVSYSRLVVITLIDLFKGTYGLNDISGPVGVVSIISEVSEVGFSQSFFAGFRVSLYMAALITVNVGIINLIPIPALDGARFVFFAVEAVRRKPVKAEIEGMIHFFGFAALMVFMLLITVLDIRKLFI